MVLKKWLFKLVMALNLKNVVVGDQTKQEHKKQETTSNILSLNKDEVETLLIMVKEAHFKGEHVQKVYELVLKLQNYYSTL